MSDLSHAVTDAVLAVEPLIAAVESAARGHGEGCGAVCTFVGFVRQTHQGRSVRYLEYEAYAPLALKTFARIEDEVHERWPSAIVVMHHRIGHLNVGEASVAIAAAAAHRAASFEVCRYVIERIKQISPIWKHEFFEDGEAWVEGPVSDPSDVTLRQQALERACG